MRVLVVGAGIIGSIAQSMAGRLPKADIQSFTLSGLAEPLPWAMV